LRDELPDVLRVEADGPVRVVVMDRPEHLNAIDEHLHAALADVWEVLAADPDARAVVLTGAGRAFSAGGDLEWVASFLDDPASGEASLREGARIVEELLRFPLPVVAAVNGPAVGLGCSIAVLCDVVLMAEDAHLADPHVAVGLAAGDGGAAFWPLLGPILRLREHLYTGDPIPAARAVELGLASRVVPPGQVLDDAVALAHRLAAQPPAALRATKRVVNLHLARALGDAVPAGFAEEAVTMASDEHRSRLIALLERVRRRRGEG